MRRLLLLLIITTTMACEANTHIDNVISNFSISPIQVLADGTTVINVQAHLGESSSSSRRGIIFTTSSGVFPNGSKSDTVKARFSNGILIGSSKLVSPTVPGTITIKAEIEFDTPLGEYALLDSIFAERSEPSEINIIPSSFGIPSTHMSQVMVSCSIRNAVGRKVSRGYKVKFEDLLISGEQAAGRFTENIVSVHDSSSVKTKYSAARHPIGTDIIIVASVLSTNNSLLHPKDSIFLTINQ